MSESRQRKHSSHLPVLELLFKYSKINDVFEYGCGVYSTNFFVEHAKTVTSIEMNKQIWYDKISKEIQSDKLKLLFIDDGEKSIEYFKSTNKIYDLVFVDGDSKFRKDCAYGSFGLAETIAVHDVNLTWKRWKHKGWSVEDVPHPYKAISMNIACPSTTVYTKNCDLFNNLKNQNIITRDI